MTTGPLVGILFKVPRIGACTTGKEQKQSGLEVDGTFCLHGVVSH